MPGQQTVQQPRTPYRRLLHEVAETVALPHTYTLLIWVTTMASVAHNGVPDLISVFCMLIGACAAFVVLGRISHRRHGSQPAVERRVIAHPYVVACLNIVTLSIAAGLCALLARIPQVHLAWLAVGVGGTTVFLFGIAAQAFVVARLTHIEA